MARKVNEDRLEDIKKVDPKLGEELEKLAELAARTTQEETPEVKKLRAALTVVEDKMVKEAIQKQINTASKPPVDMDEALLSLEELGYNPLEVLGTGIKTVINSKSWNAMDKVRKAAKAVEDAKASGGKGTQPPVGLTGKLPD